MLADAARETTRRYGAIDKPFGEVSRFHIGSYNFPGNGGFGNTGIFRVITCSSLKNASARPFMVRRSSPWWSSPVAAQGLQGSPHTANRRSRAASTTVTNCNCYLRNAQGHSGVRMKNSRATRRSRFNSEKVTRRAVSRRSPPPVARLASLAPLPNKHLLLMPLPLAHMRA